MVLDEAHHLKNEWWKALWEIKKLPGITIIALTATPPYDSSYVELNKYFDLCGPIDDEIAVPDLIKNGDLCPHQDFIHFSLPEENTLRKIVAYRERINDFFVDLKTNQEFLRFLMQLDIYVDSENHVELIYEKPSYFSSILVFLNSCGITIKKGQLKLLGITEKNIVLPSFDFHWCQILLQNILFELREGFDSHEELLASLENRLKKIGAIYRGKLNFVGENVLYKDLATSTSKFKSIVSILEHAQKNLEHRLRAVILVDYIGKEFLNTKVENESALNRVAAIPLFLYVKLKMLDTSSTAVLTGSVVLVSKEILDSIFELVPRNEVTINEVKSCNSHVSIAIRGKNRSTVTVLGELFALGVIKVLIGTKSLLGEGWDAPSINTLILASYVGSFVSSNQMRGRAVRVDPEDDEKVSSIWHLACLDPTVENGGEDFKMLTKRFRAFTGVSLQGEPLIENGISRMGDFNFNDDPKWIELKNQSMFQIAKDGKAISIRWQNAIENGKVLVNSLRMPFKKGEEFYSQKRLYALNVYKYLLYEILIAVTIAIPELLVKNLKYILGKGYLALFYIFFFFIGFRFLPKLYKALKLYLRYGNQYKRAKKMARMLVRLCHETNRLSVPFEEIEIISSEYRNGRFAISFSGLNLQESSLLIGLLEELILPIDNPRYLITVNRFRRFLGYQNYYPVPTEFGKRKDTAQLFFSYWNNYVGGGSLNYVRTLNGRKILLKARLSHILFEFVDPPEKVTSWK